MAPEDRYHHGDLRRSLLDAAASLVKEVGLSGFSMRELAKRSGVSSAAPYRHFADNHALLAALAGEVRQRFMTRVRQALLQAPDDPLERLKAYGVALILFAADNPNHFDLMHNLGLMSQDVPPEGAELDVLVELARNMQLAVESGVLRDDDPKALMLTLQSAAYGIGYLAARGLLARFGVERADLEMHARAVMTMVDEGVLAKGKANGREPSDVT